MVLAYLFSRFGIGGESGAGGASGSRSSSPDLQGMGCGDASVGPADYGSRAGSVEPVSESDYDYRFEAASNLSMSSGFGGGMGSEHSGDLRSLRPQPKTTGVADKVPRYMKPKVGAR
jgi:hypothetical protein